MPMALRDSLANAGVKMGVAGAAMGAAAMVPVKAFAEAEDEEACIQALATGLIRLMQDTPQFFPQLQALANQR